MTFSISFRYWRIYAVQGYTLIEMLIVTACIMITAMLLLPSGANDAPTQLRAAASVLIADLEFAQSASIGNNTDGCAVVINSLENSYYVARTMAINGPMENPTGRGPYRVTFGQESASLFSGVTIDADSDAVVSFNALGALDQGSDALIILKCGSDTIRIRVDSGTGYPSVE